MLTNDTLRSFYLFFDILKIYKHNQNKINHKRLKQSASRWAAEDLKITKLEIIGQQIYQIIKWIIKQQIITIVQLLRSFKMLKTFNIVYFCMLILCIRQTVSFTYSGTLAPIDRFFTHPHDVSSYGLSDVIQIHFQVTSTTRPLTTTSLLVNFGSAIQFSTIQIEDFSHKNPRDERNMDLDAMWSADQQYINIMKPAGASQLYLTVFNLDPSYRRGTVSYSIDVSGSGMTNYQCDSCANGESRPATSCFCNNCNFQAIGRRCSRILKKLTKNQSFALPSTSINYFILEGSEKLTMEVAIAGGGVEAYFQFQQFSGEVASFFNVAKGSSNAQYFINNTSFTIAADPQKRNFLVTLANLQGHPVNATIGFSTESGVSVLVIVMGVLGGVLLIALVIAVICIIKRRNSNAGRINSQLNLPSETNKLSGEQIERYFPPCIYSELQSVPVAETSMHPLGTEVTQKQVGNGSQADCVICLQQINISDTIRIGYCKHMFHSNCLISWFKKQRNCPYCRKQYNRDQTTAEYNKLVGENSNRVLKDLDLGKAIYQRKIASKTVIENLE